MPQPLHNVAVLSNPFSGRNKRGAFASFDKRLKKYPQITHEIASDPKSTFDALDQFQQDNVKLIVVNGGDGTLQAVLTYLHVLKAGSYNPFLLLLKAGTTSMSFGDVGCRGPLDKILARVMMYSATGELDFVEAPIC